MAKRRQGELEPGTEEIRTRRVRRVSETAQVDLEAWLREQANRPEVTRIGVYKRRSNSGGYARTPIVLDPPFEVDPTDIYRQCGDGEYRFSLMNERGNYLGNHHEFVVGFGEGTGRAPSGAPTIGTRSQQFEKMLADMNDMVEFDRLSLMRERYQDDLQRYQARRQTTTGQPLSPAEERALNAEALDRDLERMMKLRALWGEDARRGGHGENILEAVLPKLVERLVSPPDPADRQLDFVVKVLDLKDRIGPELGDMPDLGKMWPMLALALLANPAMRDQLLTRFLPGAASREPMAPPGMPPADRVPPAPRPPRRSPARTEVIPGEPGDGSTPERPTADPYALGAVLFLLKNAIASGKESFELYAELADEHLPGFVDEWARSDQDTALAKLGQADPYFATDPAQDWLRRWWGFLREEWLADASGGQM